jgi:hypothetical protein
VTEEEKARRFAAAISRGVTRSADEINLGADGVCAALVGVLVEQAKLANIAEAHIAEWLRDIADIIERGDEPGFFSAPKPGVC